MKTFLIFFFFLILSPSLEAATTLTYPGTAPCDTTLQACIDGAASGDTIEIANDSRIDENITINKSLTLTGAAGVTPLIGSAIETTPKEISVDDAGPAGGAVSIVLNGLNLNAAHVSVSFNDDTGHNFEMTNCTVTHSTGNNNDSGVELDATVTSTFLIQESLLSTPGQPIEFAPDLADATFSAEAIFQANRITTTDAANSHEGFQLRPRGMGTVTINLLNNVIHGVGGCNCGANSGIDIEPSDSVIATVNIINNTIDDIESTAPGLYLNTPAGTSQLTLNLFNTIISNTTVEGLIFPALSGQLTVNNDFNNFFNNGSSNDFGGYTAGANDLNADPHYVDASGADYHLETTSPLIDKGTATPTGGLPATDFDGNSRNQGDAPDIGAFETTPPPPPPSEDSTGGGCSLMKR